MDIGKKEWELELCMARDALTMHTYYTALFVFTVYDVIHVSGLLHDVAGISVWFTEKF